MEEKWYEGIDVHLRRLEEGKTPSRTILWIVDRISWCWKWRKITKEQMEELAERVIRYNRGEMR